MAAGPMGKPKPYRSIMGGTPYIPPEKEAMKQNQRLDNMLKEHDKTKRKG